MGQVTTTSTVVMGGDRLRGGTGDDMVRRERVMTSCVADQAMTGLGYGSYADAETQTSTSTTADAGRTTIVVDWGLDKAYGQGRRRCTRQTPEWRQRDPERRSR